MCLQKIEILNQEIDPNDTEPHYYRMLVNRTYFKYITIETGCYEVDDLCFPPILLEKLPQFPAGEWNCGRIGRTTNNHSPHFTRTSRENLPLIDYL